MHPSKRRPWLGRLRFALLSREAKRAQLRARVAGRRILLTGASFGIGREAAVELARAGAELWLVARDRDALDALARELGADARVRVFACDLADPLQCEALATTLERDARGVDILINNAGVSLRRPVADSWKRLQDFERTMQLNYFGALRLILAVAPGMVERGDGHVVNVSTIGVQTGAPNFASYIASKSALDQFSRCAALELASHGVHFTTLYMGLVRTRMTQKTEAYDDFPAASARKAAERIQLAILYRPIRVSTAIGYSISLIHALVPRLDAWMFAAWHDRLHGLLARRGSQQRKRTTPP